MWLELWVGRETCWHKLNVFNSLSKFIIFWSFKLSMKILKIASKYHINFGWNMKFKQRLKLSENCKQQ